MKTQHLYAAVLFLAASTVSALANQPPGPRVMFSEITLPLFMLLMCKLAGYYPLARGDEAPSKAAGIAKVVGAIILIVLSGAHEGFGMWIAVMFGGIASYRAVRMIYWSFHYTKAAGTAPKRLKICGTILLLVSLFLSGQALAFFGYWPEIGQERREKKFKDFVTFQLAYASIQETNLGQKVFHRFSSGQPKEIIALYHVNLLASSKWVNIEYGTDAKSFAAYLPPAEGSLTRLPFFPYNYLTSQPSYRADETGEIRMVRVHHNGERCPPDAPVVDKISAAEIEAMKTIIAPLITNQKTAP